MIRKSKQVKDIQNLRDGQGAACIRYLLKPDEKISQVTFIGVVELDSGASIGFHEHLDDTEVYYIIHGQGLFEEKGHAERTVESGDFCYIPKGSGHGLKNTGDDRMSLLAIVSDEGLVTT